MKPVVFWMTGFFYFGAQRHGGTVFWRLMLGYKYVLTGITFDCRLWQHIFYCMHENDLTKIVVTAAFDIHSRLGPGLFESVYETIMEYELVKRYDLHVKRQFPIPVIWDGTKMELGFRADLLVEDKLIVELKSIESLAPVYHKQMLTYLRLTGLKLGLLINFNEELLKTGIKRVINGNL